MREPVRKAIPLLLAALLLLSGCWDVRELNQMALVMAVGVDRDPETRRFEVTIQVARPGASGKGQAGGAGGATGESQAVYTASADGDTIFAAIRNLAQFTSRRIMWAHNNVVVIGESVARDDISPVIDFFTRNTELRMRTWVVVTRETSARAVVMAKTGMEMIPADSISALFRYANLPGEALSSDMTEVAAAFFSPDLEPAIASVRLTERILPVSELPGEKGGRVQVELRGTALFQGTRLVGYIEKDAGRGMLWLRRQMGNALVSIPCPQGVQGKMAVEVRDPEVSIASSVQNGTPLFRVQVATEGWLSEQDCPTPRMDVLDLKTYAEEAFAREIERDIREALELLQGEYQTDGIRFGRLLHVQHPAWWRANRKRWDQLFPRAKVEVTVSTRIPKMGLYTEPLGTNSPGG